MSEQPVDVFSSGLHLGLQKLLLNLYFLIEGPKLVYDPNLKLPLYFGGNLSYPLLMLPLLDGVDLVQTVLFQLFKQVGYVVCTHVLPNLLASICR